MEVPDYQNNKILTPHKNNHYLFDLAYISGVKIVWLILVSIVAGCTPGTPNQETTLVDTVPVKVYPYLVDNRELSLTWQTNNVYPILTSANAFPVVAVNQLWKSAT